MSKIDLFLLLLLSASAFSMIVGAKRMSRNKYSKFLVAIILSSATAITLFQWYDASIEGNSPAHSAIFSLSQFAIYGLASKIWLKINYKNSGPLTKKVMHTIAHTTLLLFIATSYWLKTVLPLATILIYPLCGFSMSLMEEFIERSLLVERNTQTPS